jgi:hypothetical protein
VDHKVTKAHEDQLVVLDQGVILDPKVQLDEKVKQEQMDLRVKLEPLDGSEKPVLKDQSD